MIVGRSRLELQAQDGRAVLVADGREADPDRFGLPDTLVRALHEWAEVVETLSAAGGEESGQVAARRARQLAVRLAVETGGEVGYLDPLTGQRNVVGRQRPAPEADNPASGPWPSEIRPSETPPSETRPSEPLPGASGVLRGGPAVGAEPTPWGTGLMVATIIAAIVVVAMVIITTGLAELSPLLAVVVNLAVSAGLAPSIWLGRTLPTWRWVALGTASGLVLSWIALLLDTLG